MPFKKYFFLLVITTSCSYYGIAQTITSHFTYDIAFQTSDLKEYIDNSSFRGLGVGMSFFPSSKLSLGYNLSWQIFKERLDGEFSSGESDLYGTQVRYANVFPLLLTGYYYFGEGNIRVYAGTGIGVVGSVQRTDVGIFLVQSNNWHFGLSPEIGAFTPVSPSVGIKASVKYNYATATEDSMDFNYLGISIGLIWFDDY